MITLVTDRDDRDEAHDLIAQASADLGLAYLLACSSGDTNLADAIHAAMMSLADVR